MLRRAGRFTVTDVIADEGMSESHKRTSCIAGAMTETEFRTRLTELGLVDFEICSTQRVHQHRRLADRPRVQSRHG